MRGRLRAWMRRGALVAWALSVFACGHRGAAKPAPSFDEQIRALVQPVPEDLRADVERAEQLGAVLHAHDRAAWVATDALSSGRDPEQLGLGGYLVLPEGDASGPNGSFQTLFYSQDDPPQLLYRVQLTPGRAPHVQPVQPPEALADGLAALARARKTALDSLQDTPQPLNPVVLPGTAIGEPGVLVYLIAGTTKQDEVVFGRHHRILVSEDASTVVRAEPLSKSALVMPKKPPGEAGFETEALIVSHLVSSTPVETHVLASLQHGVRVLVATDRGDWLVDGATITYLGPREE